MYDVFLKFEFAWLMSMILEPTGTQIVYILPNDSYYFVQGDVSFSLALCLYYLVHYLTSETQRV